MLVDVIKGSFGLSYRHRLDIIINEGHRYKNIPAKSWVTLANSLYITV